MGVFQHKDPKSLGLWMPPMFVIAKSPILGPHCLPPGHSSQDAASMLNRDRSRLFFLCDRPQARQSLSVTILFDEKILKTLLLRTFQGQTLLFAFVCVRAIVAK
jgi:hypothetical protein